MAPPLIKAGMGGGWVLGGGGVEKLCYMILTALSSLSLLGSSSNVRRHEALAIELISILQIGNSETSSSGTFQACYLADQQRMFLKGKHSSLLSGRPPNARQAFLEHSVQVCPSIA